jgi:hypothetical protein
MTFARDLASLADSATTIESAWTSYTPTFSGGTWAVGNGTFSDTRYKQIGKTVFAKGFFTFGSTTAKAAATALAISLPVTGIGGSFGVGSCSLLDSGTNNFVSGVSLSATDMTPWNLSVSGSTVVYSGLTATAPFTWATNDTIRWTIVYEAA